MRNGGAPELSVTLGRGQFTRTSESPVSIKISLGQSVKTGGSVSEI